MSTLLERSSLLLLALCLPFLWQASLVKAQAPQRGHHKRTTSARPRTRKSEQEPIHVQADSLTRDEQQNTYTASGHVTVTKGETTLTADTVTFYRVTNEMEASGNVDLKDIEGKIDAQALRFELENETGTINEGTVHLPRNQYVITGAVLQKSYGQTYHVEQGTVTTCQCENIKNADWSIGGSTIDVTLRGTGEVHDGIFRVHDIPLLYFPYGIMSVRTERQSGLLFPYYGFSSTRGFVWQQPFYWDINRSYDMTVTTDVETSARLGLWGEFRYAPGLDTEGQLSASYFNEQIRGPATTSTPVDRWSITGAHRQTLAEDAHLYSDLFVVSDDLFLREISHHALDLPTADDYADYTIRTLRYTRSRLGAIKTWPNALLRAEADYYQDLLDEQKFAFQTLPRVQFQGQQYVWHDRLAVGLAAEGDNFYRDQGYAGQRVDLAPWAALPFHLGDYAFGSFQVTGRETAYHLTAQSSGAPTVVTPRLQGDRTREIVQFEADFGTRFSRVFALQWGSLLKLQHVIEPELSYLYTPFVNQEELPLYDALDRINQRNELIYGVTNRILGKFRTTPAASDGTETGTEIRELARVTLTQAYDPLRGLNRDQQHYSDVDVAARLTPFPFTTFTFNATYDVDNGSAATTRVGAFLRDPRPLPELAPLLQHLQRATSIGLTYRSTSTRVIKDFNAGLTSPATDILPPREVDANVLLRLTDSIMASYVGRYDLNTSSFIGNRYFFRYIAPQQCWFIDVGLIDKVNPNEIEFRFLFTLVGLSSSGRTAF
jgi:LPS-assembly protein